MSGTSNESWFQWGVNGAAKVINSGSLLAKSLVFYKAGEYQQTGDLENKEFDYWFKVFAISDGVNAIAQYAKWYVNNPRPTLLKLPKTRNEITVADAAASAKVGATAFIQGAVWSSLVLANKIFVFLPGLALNYVSGIVETVKAIYEKKATKMQLFNLAVATLAVAGVLTAILTPADDVGNIFTHTQASPPNDVQRAGTLIATAMLALSAVTSLIPRRWSFWSTPKSEETQPLNSKVAENSDGQVQAEGASSVADPESPAVDSSEATPTGGGNTPRRCCPC